MVEVWNREGRGKERTEKKEETEKSPSGIGDQRVVSFLEGIG